MREDAVWHSAEELSSSYDPKIESAVLTFSELTQLVDEQMESRKAIRRNLI